MRLEPVPGLAIKTAPALKVGAGDTPIAQAGLAADFTSAGLLPASSIIRTVPRRLLSVTPEPGISPSFGVADLITVNANLRGATGGVQRVYAFTVEQDTEGNEMITNLVTSVDGEV